MTNQTAECLHCGRSFVRRKVTHVFCSSECRHHGEQVPGEREQADPALLARLFAEARDPDERVEPDEWHPAPDWADLDAGRHAPGAPALVRAPPAGGSGVTQLRSNGEDV